MPAGAGCFLSVRAGAAAGHPEMQVDLNTTSGWVAGRAYPEGMDVQTHRADARILGRRTLVDDHRRLAELLRPGLRVLDVGCGVGAITAGIAEAVGPEGWVVGVDRDEAHLEAARARYGAVTQLRFEMGDAVGLRFEREFDVVTAARTLQWVAEPERAVARMARAAKRGGLVVVLDYNLAENEWAPEPPMEFHVFYDAMLRWRASHGWRNRMAAELPGLFESAGLVGIESVEQDEVAERGAAGFEDRSKIWWQVMDNLGEALVAEEFLEEAVLQAGRIRYTDWVATGLQRQRLELRAVTGRVA